MRARLRCRIRITVARRRYWALAYRAGRQRPPARCRPRSHCTAAGPGSWTCRHARPAAAAARTARLPRPANQQMTRYPQPRRSPGNTDGRRGSSRLVKSASMCGPPNCPGGREMPWMTISSGTTPAGGRRNLVKAPVARPLQSSPARRQPEPGMRDALPGPRCRGARVGDYSPHATSPHLLAGCPAHRDHAARCPSRPPST